MTKAFYREHDYAFGQMMLTLRTAMGVTQGGLAKLLGVSRRAVGEWEAGSSYPKADHLKHFIRLGIQQRAFTAGQEGEEARALWHAAHQKISFDERWLSFLLGQQQATIHPGQPEPTKEMPPKVRTVPSPASDATGEETPPQHACWPLVDWGEALALPTFYGRNEELTLLTKWVMQEHCRVVSVLGMGGIGKSALAVTLMHQVAKQFDVVLFHSLRNAPSCENLLDECLQVLSPQSLSDVPASLGQRISFLLEHLRKVRVLVVLDNLETVLEEGDITGRFRSGFEDYKVLLRRIVETEQQGCWLLTSREKLAELRGLEGKSLPVRSLRLSGLDHTACAHVFAEKELVGTQREQERLMEMYAGNPLALKIIAETIADIFGGEINQFLSEETMIFGDIANLLAEQFQRLSPLEQTVLYWLAVARESMTIEELLAALVTPVPRVLLLEAIDSLHRRSLLERGQRQANFTLQSVMLEYTTTRLIEVIASEIQKQSLDCLITYSLEHARAREYVRKIQQCLLLTPILSRLRHLCPGDGEGEQHMLSLLRTLRQWTDDAQGYGPANLVALLREQRGNLRNLDLSHLSLRGAYLQGVEMHHSSLAGVSVRDTTFTEAFDTIWAVAISKNEAFWAATSKRGEVQVWDARSQTLHRVWQAHTDSTDALVFSPDGQMLATGSWDCALKLWDLESGALLWSGWHAKDVLSLAIAPQGSLLASGGNDAVVHLWDLHNGRRLQTLSHPIPVLSVAWSSDGRLLASGDLEGTIRVWEIANSTSASCVAVLRGHTNRVRGLAFAPDSRTLASASWDTTVKVWDVTRASLLQTLTMHTDRVNSVAWSPDGNILASCGFDKTIWLWSAEQHRCSTVLHGHAAGVNGLAFTSNGHLLSGGEDSTLRLWNIASGQCMRMLQGNATSLSDVDWHPDGTQVVGGGTDTLVTIWTVGGRRSPQLLCGHEGAIFEIGWSPDGQWVASSAWDTVIRLWNATTGTERQRLRDPAHGETILYGVAWSPNGQWLASGSFQHGVQIWTAPAWSHWRIGDQLPTWIRHVAWSPDSTRLVGCGDDGKVYLWNASDGSLHMLFPGHQGVVTSAAWSPDGTRLASAGRNKDSGEMLVWDVQSGERIQAFVSQAEVVYAVVWGSSGDWLISGGSNGTLCWWNVPRGECVRISQTQHGIVRSLRRSPDGSRLASCGDDGAITLWDLESGECLETLRRDRPYERLDITDIKGLTDVQKATLLSLGAIIHDEMA